MTDTDPQTTTKSQSSGKTHRHRRYDHFHDIVDQVTEEVLSHKWLEDGKIKRRISAYRKTEHST